MYEIKVSTEFKQLRATKNRRVNNARVRNPVDLPKVPKNRSERALLFIRRFTKSKNINTIDKMLIKSNF
jgi:hypothetical protein